MRRSAAETRQRILDSAYQLFLQRGYARVSTDEIVSHANVTKPTLYRHFGSKDQLLADVIAAQHEKALQSFDLLGDEFNGTPETIVREMFREIVVRTSQSRWLGAGCTRLVFELADLPEHPACVLVRRHKLRLENKLCALLEQSGVVDARDLAKAIWLLSEGSVSLILIHGDHSYSNVACAIAITLVQEHIKKHEAISSGAHETYES